MVRHQIVMKRADFELTLTLIDTKLIICAGESRVDQDFPNAPALVEHAMRMVKLRQSDGFRVVAERNDNELVMPPEPIAPAPAALEAEMAPQPKQPAPLVTRRSKATQ